MNYLFNAKDRVKKFRINWLFNQKQGVRDADYSYAGLDSLQPERLRHP